RRHAGSAVAARVEREHAAAQCIGCVTDAGAQSTEWRCADWRTPAGCPERLLATACPSQGEECDYGRTPVLQSVAPPRRDAPRRRLRDGGRRRLRPPGEHLRLVSLAKSAALPLRGKVGERAA